MGRNRFYKKLHKVVGLAVLIQFMLVVQLLGQCNPTTDLNTLKALFNAGWNLNNWNNTETNPENMANWEGVTLSGDGCVTSLDVGDKNLGSKNNGQIPDAIGGFTAIKVLDLHNNGFTGNINRNIYKLTTLTQLSLQQNKFKGTIDDGAGAVNKLSNLKSLIVLGLDNIQGQNQTDPSLADPDFVLQAPAPLLTGLNNLQFYFVRNHEYFDVPDFPNEGGLVSIGVSGNNHTFEDIIEFVDANRYSNLQKFFFHPMKDFSVPQNTYNENENDVVTIDLGVDQSLENSNTPNTYDWYKSTDGGNTFSFYKSTDNINALTFDPIAVGDAGIYYCEVRNAEFDRVTGAKYLEFENNDNIPENELLRIRSENITVNVEAVNQEICPRDREVLVQLYNNLGGENWTNSTNWNSDLPISDWKWTVNVNGQNVTRGVVEVNNEGCVVELNLENNNLDGNQIPDAIGNFSSIQKLVLSNNKIRGNIPQVIGQNLTGLTHLYLDRNDLIGTIPTNIGTLTDLQFLHVNQNQLTGTIPASLGNLGNLRNFSLWQNALSGEIPTELAGLTECRYFAVGFNNLSGGAPEFLGNLSALEELYLRDNQDLTGPLPNSLTNLANLEIFEYQNTNLCRPNNSEFIDWENSVNELITNGQNCNPPTDIFLSNNAIEVNLGILANITVGTLTTEDADNPDDVHTYALTNDCGEVNDNGLFTISGNELIFSPTVAATIGAISYRVCIKSTDQAGDSFSKGFDIRVNVANNPPTDITLDNNVINSDALAGSLVGNLTTTDEDLPDDTHVYTLTDACNEANSNNLFAITGNELRLADDFVLPASVNPLTVCITTTDGAQESYSELFTIRINVLNNPPTDITLDNNVINSDALAGSLVGNLTTTDEDLPDDTHVYTLTEACNETNNNNLFAINGNELRLADDFVLPVSVNSLTVCITTTDGAQESYSELFTIRINVLNNPPTDILLSNTIIEAIDAAPGFIVGTLSTVDADLPDDSHTYTLSNECEVVNDNNLFAIVGDQLLLSPTFSLAANVTSLRVCITTTDEAEATFTKSFEITIRPTINDCVANDKAVLEAIYDALGGDTWGEKTNWKSDAPLNEWFGVETNENGCITRIILEDNNLSGSIPAEIGNLSEIIEINFGKNAILGTVPADFGKLATLEMLWLNENNLTGQIPAGFFGMSGLKNLYLFQNNIQPPMPNELNQLAALEVFGFDNNDTPFTDTDFPAIGNLAALQKFFIRNHDFENVPTVTNLDLLTEMGLADNRLTFEDILPFSGLNLNVFIYAPQDSVGEQNAVTLQAGEPFTFDLGIDPNITNNIYKWYRDGELIAETNLNTFTIDAVEEDDAGEYTCEVTNPDAPELTLYSRKTTLTVTPQTELPPPVLTAELDPTNPAERVLLSWTYSDDFAATSYTIEKSVGDSLNFNTITSNWTETNFTDADGLIPGETYYYRVNALVDNEVSPYSNIAFVTTNDLPTIADIDKAGLVNSTVNFQLADFTNAFEDPDGDQLAVIQVLSLPVDGQLLLNGIAVAINDEIQNTEIGNLTFEPAQDFVGSASFEYNASDGFNYAEEPATVNITIEDVEEVDLLVSNANASTDEVEAGNTLNVSATITVSGGPTEDEAIFVLLLSEDTIPDQGDIPLNSAEIPAQTSTATQQISTEVVIPDDIAPGEYYIIYFVDARQDVLESNELNNIRYFKISILPQEPEGPELTIMNLITANSDGFNDELFIKNIENYPDNEVIFLDRWGNEIFRTSGYQNDWKPVVGENILDFGAYVCIVKVDDPQVVLKRMVSITRGDGQQ